MQIELNYKSILQTRATPMTPLYTGSWNPRFSTKWLGMAAELSYNPYLRNGWVSVDTGVKGTVGSPLIEFSTWEAENSTYNITIPNSFSYSFSFKGESNCVSKFLTRSSVEAQEWWFGVSGVNTILNLWGRGAVTKTRAAVRNRTQFTSLVYLNYRFTNFHGSANLMLSGLIPANLNQVTGVTSVDSHVRDLSINFLYLNQIVKHRLARIRFYLHERAVAAQLESVLNRNLPGFFSEQIFFSCVSARFFKTASTATSVTTDSAFFRTVGLKNLSFESLVGALSTTLFLFLEFKESPVFLNFFFVALRKIVEELVFLFGSRSFNFSFGGLQFKKVSVFILRRLFKFILTTRLSTYSFMILLVHAIREFVSHLPQITGAAIVSSELSAALALYTYKLRQLTAIPVPGSCASDRLNNIFLKNVVLGKDLLTSYAKHRGRGLRMFRRGRAFFSKKRRFNFIGRRPKYYFSKKKNNIFADEAETGFSFSNRLHCLRRALKFSSTSGQFTFLFFWSFQFFNFNQLNLKKRKFFFLTMRVAYFFKAFLRFFKFYAFYFRFLRDWDLPGQELYSYTGESITNLKVYCILLFIKFARLLVNFRVFCSKIFLLKWRRSCAITMSEVRDLRAVTTNFFINGIHSANSGLTKGVHKFSSPRLPVSITSKFLIWSYSAFNNFIRRAEFTDSAVKTRYYLRYLLKLRANYLHLYMNQFYSACASNLLKSRLEVSSSFGRVVVRRVLTSLFNLPLHSRLMGLRRAVISAVGGAFLSNKGGFLCDRRELYTEIELGLITKISFSALRRLVSCCILRRKFLKHRVAVKLTSKFASRFRHNSVTKGRVVSFLKFLSRFYGGSLGPHFSSLIKRMSWSQLMVTSSKFDSLSLFLVKRYLLAWKANSRSWVSSSFRLGGGSWGGLRVLPNTFRFLFFRKSPYLGLARILSGAPLLSSTNETFLTALRPTQCILESSVGAPVDYKPYLISFPVEGLKFQLNSVLKILHFSGDIRGAKTSCISCALRYNSNSLFFRRSLGFTSVFSESRLFDLTNPYGNFAPFSAASLSSKAEPHDFFMVIWGSYLALNTWALKIFPLFTKLPRLPSLMQTTAELYELTGLHLNGGSFTFSRLVYASDYLQKQFTTLNSFLAFSASLLRSALFDATLGLYAKSFFMRNLALQKNSYKFVRVAFNRSANLLSRTYVDNFFSFAASQYFPRYLVSSLSSSSSACLPNLLSVSGFHPYRKVTSYLLKDLMFGALFFGLSSPKVFKHFELRNGVFYHAKTRILRSKFSRYRLSSLRTPVAVSANRVLLNWKSIAFRKLCRLYAVTEVKSAAAKAVPISLLSKNRSAFYLKSVLRLLHRFNTQDRPSTTFGLQFSLGSYSLRVNRFFNIMRAVPPLRVLTYAKKIGIWPRNLRLRPKKAKPKRVLEINISKNKQSLVPDKNFKMPPSIFSRENYESMNLIWDFPHDDYKFARVNMTKWAKAWRFTRKQLARSLLGKLKRNLKLRYFRRTFRYRKFLRKRWFRKKLKRAVCRALVRATSKLNMLSSFRAVYKGGVWLKRFSSAKLYYSPALTYSLVLDRFLFSVYSRFLRTKLELRTNFMRKLKLQFLFLLIRGFFTKTLTFFSNFTWTYRLTFGSDFSAAWFFNKLSTLILAAPRMYAFGASYYWSEPLALFNSKLMGNYVNEDFFQVRVLPDYFVIRTIGPEYYPYDSLISTLPWRTNNVGFFEAYPGFLLSNVFSSVIKQTLFGVVDLRSSLENVNTFSDVICNLFSNCGFRLWLPARRRGNKVVHATPITPYNKPARRAQILRLVKKLLVLRPLKLFKKFKLNAIKQSRTRLKGTDYVSSPSLMFEVLRLRPLYVTLFKRKLRRNHYRLLCRAVRVIADAHRYSWPSKLKVWGRDTMYTSNSKIVRVRRPRFSIRRRRLHWRVRKSIASRRVRLRGLRQFRRLSRPVNIYTRLPKRKRPSLFTYKEPGLGRSSFSSASDSVRLPVWGRAQLFVRRIRRAQRARSKRLSNSLGAPKAIGRKKTNVPLRS